MKNVNLKSVFLSGTLNSADYKEKQLVVIKLTY